MRAASFLGFPLTALPPVSAAVIHDSSAGSVISAVLWTGVIIFSALMIYSVFIELMLFAPKDGTAYRKGTYRYVRHPGWIWYTAVHLLIAVMYFSQEVLLLMLWCILLNLTVILIEDAVLFPKLFSDYPSYKKQARCIL